MPTRYKRKVHYLRGSRRMGRGNIKNRRGSGNRGGRGRAGLHKHKWSSVAAREEEFFGKHGFRRPNKKRVPVVNIWEIENYVEKGALEKDGEHYVFHFKGKVLGFGKLSYPVKVYALSFSKKAKEKIEAAGGQALQLE